MLLVGGSPVGIGVYGYSLGSLRERIGGRSTFMRFQMLNAQGQSAFAKASADKEAAVPSRRLSEGIGGRSRVRVISGGLIRLRQRLWRTKWEWCKLSWLYFLSAYASCKIHFVFFKITQTANRKR